MEAARVEGPGNKYLIQHSAGSGKTNSIAWTAHQLSSLYDGSGNKTFHSVTGEMGPPLFIVSANRHSLGKTYLLASLAEAVTGTPATTGAWPEKKEGMEKVIGAIGL